MIHFRIFSRKISINITINYLKEKDNERNTWTKKL